MKKMCASFLRVCMLGVLILMANSCSKESDPGPNRPDVYFIRFAANGSKKEYKMFGEASLRYVEQDLFFHGEGIAGLTSDPSKESLAFFLLNEKDFQVGKSYNVKNKAAISGSNSALPELWIVYLDGDGNSYTALITTIGSRKDEAELTFTEITNAYVKGTFSAKAQSSEGKEMIITAGEFMLERID